MPKFEVQLTRAVTDLLVATVEVEAADAKAAAAAAIALEHDDFSYHSQISAEAPEVALVTAVGGA